MAKKRKAKKQRAKKHKAPRPPKKPPQRLAPAPELPPKLGESQAAAFGRREKLTPGPKLLPAATPAPAEKPAPALAVESPVSADPVVVSDRQPLAPARSNRFAMLGFGAAAAVALVVSVVAMRGRAGPSTTPTPTPAAEPAPSASVASLTAAAGSPAAPPPSTPARFADQLDLSTFQKGNIHTHSNLSDGDRPPDRVYAWYRDRGYNFLALTDHNTLTDPGRFRGLEWKKKFVMITGEEVTMRGAGKQVHVNALCTKKTIGGRSFDTQEQALAWGVDQVTRQGGVALVNHPNWDWALTADHLPAARGATLLEIASGHPYVHTEGDGTHLSHEAIWDVALTAGQDLAGVAVDDAHIYGDKAPDNAARPGRAWIYVAAPEPTEKAICAALAKARLYASTGVSLKRIVVEGTRYVVYPADASATVEFIGKGGRVLATTKAAADGAATYELTGDEGYVRARITSIDGRHAWTEPSRVVR